ncbi:MAG: hypothetical protein ACPG77_02255 [Nannocystaceae bacterium]
MKAFQRILGASGLWFGLWLFQMLLAYTFSRPVGATVAKAIEPYTYLNSQILPGLGELFAQNSELGALIATSVITAGVLSAIAWIAVSAGVVERLRGPRTAAEVFGTAASKAPHMLVVTVYACVARALALVTLGMVIGNLEQPLLKGAIIFATWSLCTVALDRARSQIVIHEASALHPRTLIHSFRDLIRKDPKSLAAGVALNFAAMLVGVCSLLVLVWGLGTGWAIWAGRALAGLTLGLTLWRIAIAVDSVERT